MGNSELIKAFDPSRRFREGDIPSPNDPELLAVISSARTELLRYQSEISHELNAPEDITAGRAKSESRKQIKRHRIEELESEKLNLEEYIKQCETLRSACHILAIPNELLYQIFCFAASERPILARGKVALTSRTLGRVCSRWRHLSLSLREVWSPIDWIDFAGVSTQDDIVAFRRFLAHVHMETVNVNLSFRGKFRLKLHPGAVELLRMEGADLLSMCKSASLYLPVLADALQSGMDLSGLESLTLTGKTPGSDPVSVLQNQPRIPFPNLRTLALSNVHDYVPNLAGWASLTHLTLDQCCWPLMTHALTHCVQLQVLSLSNCDASLNSHPLGGQLRPIVLDQLIKLIIGFALDDHPLYHDFLKALVTPKLSQLFIREKLPRTFLDSVAGLINRSGCSISTLSILCVAFSQNDLGQSLVRHLGYMKCMPDVEVFCWTIVCVSRMTHYGYSRKIAILPLLHPSEGLLPRLTQLEIDMPSVISTEQEFVDLVTSRFQPPPETSSERLRSVSLRVSGGTFDVRYWKPLGEMQVAGLRISVRDAEGFVKSRQHGLL